MRQVGSTAGLFTRRCNILIHQLSPLMCGIGSVYFPRSIRIRPLLVLTTPTIRSLNKKQMYCPTFVSPPTSSWEASLLIPSPGLPLFRLVLTFCGWLMTTIRDTEAKNQFVRSSLLTEVYTSETTIMIMQVGRSSLVGWLVGWFVFPSSAASVGCSYHLIIVQMSWLQIEFVPNNALFKIKDLLVL